MKLTNLLLYSSLLAASLHANSLAPVESLTLGEVTHAVAARNPSVKAAKARWLSMKARVPQASAWEDLQLRGESVVSRFVNINPNGFNDQTLALEQEVPLTGKNRSRARAATAEAGEAFADLRRTQLDVGARARAAYYRLANEYAQLEVNRRNAGLLDQFAALSQARYEVGNAREAEILTAKTDGARLDDIQADIQRRISDAQTELNVLMNRPAQAPLGVPSPLTFAEIPNSLGELQSVALAARPEMQRARSRIEAGKARVQLARRQRLPDPSLSVKAGRYNDTGHAVSELDVGVSIGLPFLNTRKYAAGITEAQRNLEAAQEEFDAARNETLGLVRDQLRKIETAAQHYALCHDKILPLASQTLKSQRAAYEASSSNFLELIGAERVLQDIESNTLTYLADYRIGLAELDAIVGLGDATAQQNFSGKEHSE